MHSELEQEFTEFLGEVVSKYPQLESGLISPDVCNEGDLSAALNAFQYASRRSLAGLSTRDGQIEAFARVSFDFMRLQARFMLSGKYAATANPSHLTELYEDDSRMNGYYLDGLLVTYMLWPNHARFYRNFLERFLPIVSEIKDPQVGEIGVGHGLMATKLIESISNAKYTALDISSASLEFTKKSFDILDAGANLSCIKFDAVSEFIPVELEEKFDAFVCCEVLEHVENPEKMLQNIFRLLKPGSPVLLTTVCNMEAEDHIYLFNNPDEIVNMVREAGFSITFQEVIGLDGYPNLGPVPLNYLAILSK